MDAEANGVVLMDENTSVTRFPRSCSMIGRIVPAGGNEKCRRDEVGNARTHVSRVICAVRQTALILRYTFLFQLKYPRGNVLAGLLYAHTDPPPRPTPCSSSTYSRRDNLRSYAVVASELRFEQYLAYSVAERMTTEISTINRCTALRSCWRRYGTHSMGRYRSCPNIFGTP